MFPVAIRGIGVYAPGAPIDHAELRALTGLDINADKLTQKLGIHRRHIAHLRGLPETTADFATHAARAALADAGIDASALDLIVVGTDTPEYISPSTSMVVQGRLTGGETWAASFDVAASCASFTIALDTAVRILASREDMRHALVIGVYNMQAFVRSDDVFGMSIFADGAGAFILEKSAQSAPSVYIDGQQLTDGTQWDYIGVYAGGTHQPVTRERLDSGAYGLQLLQPMPADRNVRLWPMAIERLLGRVGMPLGEVDHFIFTQINRSVIEQVMEVLGQPLEKTTFAMEDYGYTGSACVPMAFHHAVTRGKIKRGDRVLMAASGAGLAVGCNLLVY